MKTKTNKLNWNGLTDKEQELTESIINRDVFTLCNELIQYVTENGDHIDFDKIYNEENDTFKEIFQYFSISGWLYDELSKVGGCVAEFKGLYIWAKTDFGQGMEMNHELKTIAKNVIKRS